MKTLLAATTFALMTAGAPAWAACVYNGTYYEAGTQLCFDGWLQECTVADYWSAIGMCKAPDAPGLVVEERSLSETLIARALGEDRETDPRQSRIVR